MNVSVTVEHNLDPKKAAKLAKPVMVEALKAFNGENISVEWRHLSGRFTCTSMGFKVTGDAVVTDKDATVNIELPMVAASFKGQVIEAVQTRLGKAFNGK